MTAKKSSLPNKKKKTRTISIMDRELDDSLCEIKKLLVMNAWINMVHAKEICKNTESERILEFYEGHLDSLISKQIFQEKWK